MTAVELIKCIQCGKTFESTDELTYWDDSGYGYSTKLSRCRYCGQLNIIRYQKDKWLIDNNEKE